MIINIFDTDGDRDWHFIGPNSCISSLRHLSRAMTKPTKCMDPDQPAHPCFFHKHFTENSQLSSTVHEQAQSQELSVRQRARLFYCLPIIQNIDS
jgi:hypothetical protein